MKNEKLSCPFCGQPVRRVFSFYEKEIPEGTEIEMKERFRPYVGGKLIERVTVRKADSITVRKKLYHCDGCGLTVTPKSVIRTAGPEEQKMTEKITVKQFLAQEDRKNFPCAWKN